MADEQPQNPNNQGSAPPQQQPQQQPQQVQQAPQQPPRPPANAQEIIAAQQVALQQQIAMAQQRDRAQFGPAAEGAGVAPAPVLGGVFAQASQQQGQPQSQQQQSSPPPPQGVNLPQGQTAQQVAQGIPSQGLAGIPNPAIAQQGGMQPPDFSRLPDPSVPQSGVTVQQLAAGAQIQGAPPPQFQYAPQQPQQSQQPQQQAENKPRVLWHPARNSQIVIELEEAIIVGLPDSIEQETNPQAKVVAVLLSEIFNLRSRLEQLEQGGGGQVHDEVLSARVYRLEQTLFEQTQALKQGAQAFREEQQRQAELDLLKKQQEGQSVQGGDETQE